jgi:hypothetical protein
VWFSFRRYEFKIVWSPHGIFKHRVISAVKTLLVFRIKLCMLEFDQKYFMKIPFERSISWFHNKMKTKKRHVSLKDEMWSQNKMQNDKIHNRNDLTGQHPSWISYSSHICVLPSNSNHSSFWGCSGDKMIDDIIFHKLSRILETLASVQVKWSRNPPWYSHLVSGLYHLGNSGCIRFRSDKSGIWYMRVDKLKWQRNVNLDKDIWAVHVMARPD